MKTADISKYKEIVNRLNNKFEFKFIKEKIVAALSLRKTKESKVEGMILGGTDYIITCNLFDNSSLDFGIGFNVSGRLYETSQKEINRVIGLAKRGTMVYDQKLENRIRREAKKDILGLRDSEKALYDNGFVLPVTESSLSLF